MNKNAIKKFAIEARKKLIASVSDRAGMLGITPEGCSEPISKGIDFEVYKTIAGTEVTLGRTQCEQRRKLKEQIEARGFEAVVEEVAYTWFNRICAIRFMEVNDYLPTRVRVLSSEKEGKTEPDIVMQAPDVDLDFTDKEREYILDCKMNNKLDELFKMLFIKQCNKLSEILPELFEATEDYTEMLLNISYTNKDDVISMLVNPDTGIPEADFNVSTIGEDGQPTGQVEIIGWLYQYYNTELKDDTFAQLKKNIKISKERIPAATQLFTPDWIVRYMVENSVGRLWIDHLRAVDTSVNEKEIAERFGWKYYLPEAEQEAEVNVKLAEIRTSYKDLKPEDITCIDPCMGSGHILVAMFDVLMDIYKSAGYSERDAALEIIEHNIHGLDIDKRAYQLAYFAVMIKGRGYNRRFFLGKDSVAPFPNLYKITESNDIDRNQLKHFGLKMNPFERNNALNQINGLLDTFIDGRDYGSIIRVENYDWDVLLKYIDDLEVIGQISIESIGIEQTQAKIKEMICIARAMSSKYHIVCTNPPYMGGRNVNEKLLNMMEEEYAEGKADLYAVFIIRCMELTKCNGYNAMITQHSWMFLSSFERLRRAVLSKNIVNMSHLGPRAFEEISGEVVQTTAWISRNLLLSLYKSKYVRLVDFESQRAKQNAFLNESARIYHVDNTQFENVPGQALAYWLGNPDVFTQGKLLEFVANPRQGLKTLDNDYYIRFWYEVDRNNICFNASSAEESIKSKCKWFPINHGGEYRKYYGNNLNVVNWYNDGEEMKKNAIKKYNSITRTITNISYYFRPGITWSVICSSPSFRWYNKGFIFSNGGQCVVPDTNVDLFYLTALLNSKVTSYLLNILSPTLGFESGYLKKIPVILDENKQEEISNLARRNIELCKKDWDEQELSWDFDIHPIVRVARSSKCTLLSEAFSLYEKECENAIEEYLRNEETINELFVQIYGLEGTISTSVERKDVCLEEYNPNKTMKSLLSYFVGCSLGRYLHDGPKVDDNILLITDEAYFEKDVVYYIGEYIRNIFGNENFELNMQFVVQSLGGKSDSYSVAIRTYFIKEFYLEHCRLYQKCPIYWLFDSGKENAVKALMYVHNYTEDQIGIFRTEYLHKMESIIEAALSSAEYTLTASSSAIEKATATKSRDRLAKQLAELHLYDEVVAHVANQRYTINVDLGVRKNYEMFQDVAIAHEGKKAITLSIFGKVK